MSLQSSVRTTSYPSALYFRLSLSLFTLLPSCSSLASLASLLSSDTRGKTSPQGICMHSSFCLEVPFPQYLHPSPFKLSLKVTLSACTPLPTLFYSKALTRVSHVSFLLIDWFCPLQWKVNSTEAGFRWIHSSPCPQHLEKCLVVGRNWITYAEYVII